MSIIKFVNLIVFIIKTFCYCEDWYQVITAPLNTIPPEALYDKYNSTYLSADVTKAVEDYLSKEKQSTTSKHVPTNLANLESMLENFANDKCLIVINNFIGTEIKETVPIPVILRQFELAISYRRWSWSNLYTNIIWIPNEYLPKLNNNFTGEDKEIQHCHISDHFMLLDQYHQSGYCVGLSHHRFSSSSKPWHCEVQVDLFMPDNVFRLGKHTQIFRCWFCNSISSSMPKINILISTESINAYDAISIATWMSRDKYDFFADRSLIHPVSDFMMFGSTTCKLTFSIYVTNNCEIADLSVLFPCTDCKKTHLTHKVSFQHLQIDLLILLGAKHKFLLATGYADGFSTNRFTFSGIIRHFIETQKNALTLPLKNIHRVKSLYMDNTDKLAFAYASVFKDILGNVTSSKPETLIGMSLLGFERRIEFLILEENDIRNEDMTIEFKFGQLHIVSCGSRGIEPISFLQVATVFENGIWVFLFLIVISLTGFSYHLLRRSFSASLLSIFKVLVEQGDPFPENNKIIKKLKFVVCGTLLAGLVISNAFKSDNIYKVVTPRQRISYESLDELLEDNFRIFSRISTFDYQFDSNLGYFYLEQDNHTFRAAYNDRWQGSGETEAYHFINRSSNLFQNFQMHPDTFKVFAEPIDLFDPLLRTGEINLKCTYWCDVTFAQERFWTNQKDLIVKDMENCSKTAWILPKYYAEDISKNLRKSGHHSDLGEMAYTKLYLCVGLNGLMPLSLLGQYSLIQTSGILEWWSNLINRTDIIVTNENIPPSKPNMKGHLQVLFYGLSIGHSIAFVGWIFELLGRIGRYMMIFYAYCRSRLRIVLVKFRNKQRRISD